MSEFSWQNDLQLALESQNLDVYGIQPISQPVSIEFYKQWLSKGHHAEMSYLKDHADQKADVRKLLQSGNSVISVLAPYSPHPEARKLPVKALKIARYARGDDYHHWLLAKLNAVSENLKQKHPEEEFLCFTDSKPLLEKEWAARNNLGWVGKNSLLLNPKLGSLFFLGEIVTSLKVESALEPFTVPDLCGKCSACIDHCPTDAILDDRSLDARKCLAYWNIEAKSAAPLEIRDKFEGWLFGCDICQDVCPWNNKVIQKEAQAEEPSREDLLQDLLYILHSSNKRLQKDFAGTPVNRAGGKGLKRSALSIIAGWRLKELRPRTRGTDLRKPRARRTSPLDLSSDF
jgi:epoxyqueuosine reductase